MIIKTYSSQALTQALTIISCLKASEFKNLTLNHEREVALQARVREGKAL